MFSTLELFRLCNVILFFTQFFIFCAMVQVVFSPPSGPDPFTKFGIPALKVLALGCLWFGVLQLSLIKDEHFGNLYVGTYQLVPSESGAYYTLSEDAISFHYQDAETNTIKLGVFPRETTTLIQSLTEEAYAAKIAPESFFSLEGWTYELIIPHQIEGVDTGHLASE